MDRRSTPKKTFDYKGLWKPLPKGLSKMNRTSLLKKIRSIRNTWEKYTGINQGLDEVIIKNMSDKELRDSIKFYSSDETKLIAKNWIARKKNTSFLSKIISQIGPIIY